MKPLAAIDCFAGAGGLALGLQKAGFDLRAAFDSDRPAVATYRRNIGPHIVEGDARKMRGAELLAMAGMRRGEVDVVAGGPPCQGFSNQRRGQDADSRNELIFEFLRIVREISPKCFLMENVSSMNTRGKAIFVELIKQAHLAGYRTSWKVLNAADFGVPQIRKRMFVVGVRDDLPNTFMFPNPTHRLRARGNRTQVAQHRFVLSGNVLTNQLLAAALHEAEALARSDPLNSEILTTARLYSPILADADAFRILRSPQRTRADLFERALVEIRSFPELRNALLLARPLVLHAGIWASAVEAYVPNAYFLNLESLFEDSVRTVVRSLVVNRYRVVKGASLKPALFRSLPERYIADPDIVFISDELPPVVADCKYKELDSTPSHSDIYQLLSHCTCIASDTGVLIYPGATSNCSKVGTTVGNISVWCITARPTHLHEDLQRSLTTLGLTSHLLPTLAAL